MFSRATIRLGIGPHSSFFLFLVTPGFVNLSYSDRRKLLMTVRVRHGLQQLTIAVADGDDNYSNVTPQLLSTVT